MLSIIIVCLSLITNATLFFLMYNEVYVPTATMPILIMILTLAAYIFVGYFFGETRNKTLNRILVFSATLNIVFIVSGLFYHHWKLDNLIQPSTMMKISLFVLIGVIIYLNVIYIRAEISYKRKRGNQRIQKEPKKGQMEIIRERRKKDDDDEIEIVLGNSTESEERSPPV